MVGQCRSRALQSFVAEVKLKYKKRGLQQPTTDRIVRFILKKYNVKTDDVLQNEIIRF